METETEEEHFDEYESGPFCRHWGDPADCDELCANCHHKCSWHQDECNFETQERVLCDCAFWVEET